MRIYLPLALNRTVCNTTNIHSRARTALRSAGRRHDCWKVSHTIRKFFMMGCRRSAGVQTPRCCGVLCLSLSSLTPPDPVGNHAARAAAMPRRISEGPPVDLWAPVFMFGQDVLLIFASPLRDYRLRQWINRQQVTDRQRAALHWSPGLNHWWSYSRCFLSVSC